MTNADIDKLIAAGENLTCEFKANFNAETIETLVAFANADGGTVLLGVADDGEVVGVNQSKEGMQNWVNEVKNKTAPHLIPDISLKKVNEKNVVALYISEYPVKPVAYEENIISGLATRINCWAFLKS